MKRAKIRTINDFRYLLMAVFRWHNTENVMVHWRNSLVSFMKILNTYEAIHHVTVVESRHKSCWNRLTWTLFIACSTGTGKPNTNLIITSIWNLHLRVIWKFMQLEILLTLLELTTQFFKRWRSQRTSVRDENYPEKNNIPRFRFLLLATQRNSKKMKIHYAHAADLFTHKLKRRRHKALNRNDKWIKVNYAQARVQEPELICACV